MIALPPLTRPRLCSPVFMPSSSSHSDSSSPSPSIPCECSLFPFAFSLAGQSVLSSSTATTSHGRYSDVHNTQTETGEMQSATNTVTHSIHDHDLVADDLTVSHQHQPQQYAGTGGGGGGSKQTAHNHKLQEQEQKDEHSWAISLGSSRGDSNDGNNSRSLGRTHSMSRSESCGDNVIRLYQYSDKGVQGAVDEGVGGNVSLIDERVTASMRSPDVANENGNPIVTTITTVCFFSPVALPFMCSFNLSVFLSLFVCLMRSQAAVQNHLAPSNVSDDVDVAAPPFQLLLYLLLRHLLLCLCLLLCCPASIRFSSLLPPFHSIQSSSLSPPPPLSPPFPLLSPLQLLPLH